MTRKVWVAVVLGCQIGALPGCSQSVEIPEYSMIVKRGSRNPNDIVAVFPRPTRLSVSDARLRDGEVLPYWRWQFQVGRDLPRFTYTVSWSIMGTPEEGLKYRDHSQAGWQRRELEAWAGQVLQKFEADEAETLAVYHAPPTDAERETFKRTLTSWFQRSAFANQGIHIEDTALKGRE